MKGLAWACFALLVIAAASCGGFKSGGGDDAGAGDGGSGSGSGNGSSGSSSGGRSGSNSSGSSSGAGSSSGSAYGAGPLGDLPTGYCCTTDADCRDRHCVDQGGGNLLCEDECVSGSACTGLLTGFSCVPDDAGLVSLCTPTTPGAACVPAASYAHGTKPLGACCLATHDARAGQECAGGHCDTFGADTNPYICTNACDPAQPTDCPGNYQCIDTGTYGICAPAGDPYGCQP
jgi:hypothetical protein